MCGICGIIDFHGNAGDFDARLPAMVRSLHHRGPDQCGTRSDGHAGLGHTRLSIIDVSDGKQPLSNEDATIWITYNGELYNFQELRPELVAAGHRFRTRTDTEVIVHLYEQYGLDCVQKLRGMFAFGIWDARRQRLLLVRDQIGIKPLYYTLMGERLIFGSEIKAILAHGQVPREVSPQAFCDYLSFLYVPSPKTMFKGICKLPAGCWLTFDREGLKTGTYWDLKPPHPPGVSGPQIEREIVDRLEESVRLQMVSDVPLGAFLSGGVDSSSVVAMMRKGGADHVVTASVGFEEKAYDELPFARRVAQRYGTEHHEKIVQPQAPQVIEKLAWHYDEPFADYSSVPTYYVSQAAREHVTVALSGDGGDENFGGYSRYRWVTSEERVRRFLPPVLRRWGVAPLAAVYPQWQWLPRALRAKATLASLAQDYEASYLRTIVTLTDGQKQGFFTADLAASLGGYSSCDIIRDYMRRGGRRGLDQLMYAEIKTYLVDDILTKVDRASMAVALEVRVPLLDHTFVQFAHDIPARLKIRGGQGKAIFKTAMRPYLDDETLYRRKQGFHPPIGQWMRGSLKAMVGDLLLSPRAAVRDYIRGDAIRSVWDEHQSGRHDHVTLLWTLLMFELWAGLYLHSGAGILPVSLPPALACRARTYGQVA
jgi:asparagine synthase (glutamine-hydrolysing)